MKAAELPPTLRLYRAATAVAQPFAGALLAYRARRGKEDLARADERKGIASRPRPEGVLVWLHGASVGETISLLPIITRLCEKSLNVLVTSVTTTSAQVLARRLPAGALHQYAPLDTPLFMRRFFDHWRPDLALFAESELWPNAIVEARRRQIPLALVNARMSERSLARWRRLPRTIEVLAGSFDLCLAQTEIDAERYRFLGAHGVVTAGNLKYDVPPPPADQIALASLKGMTAGRPVLLAASTHAGEEAIVAETHRMLAQHFPSLLTIIAPRHPERGSEIASTVKAAGLRPAMRSRRLGPDSACDIYVADTVGELGLFYRLTPIVFMGKSLVPHGGQNPIEPAKLGAAILHGPHVQNFESVYRALDEAGGAREITDGRTLALAFAQMIADPKKLREMVRAAGMAVERLTGAVDRTMGAIEPYLVHFALGAR
ncbi:MAG: 3-deoxy-D-manno-octulosonic acid transferase [Hyphomicrobiales bacterium]|nr:3-deoxy-D-manno-octulosonic acid transferase [Hyphomicrobiales bacterium]